MSVKQKTDKPSVHKSLVIIGTSSSLDYLNDTTGNRRFWPVSPEPSSDDDLPLHGDTRRFTEAAAGKWIVEAGELKGFWPVSPDSASDDEATFCDGLHDEGSPANYLCSRCFKDLREGDLAESDEGDLAEPNEDENRYDEEEID